MPSFWLCDFPRLFSARDRIHDLFPADGTAESPAFPPRHDYAKPVARCAEIVPTLITHADANSSHDVARSEALSHLDFVFLGGSDVLLANQTLGLGLGRTHVVADHEDRDDRLAGS